MKELRELEGGCTAPIGAIAEVSGNKVKFTAVLNSLDGAEELRVKHDSEVGSVSEGATWVRFGLENYLVRVALNLWQISRRILKSPDIID